MARIRILGWILIILFAGADLATSQYVRSERFASERERRNRYALDDWISYLSGKYISNIAVGRDYIYFATLDGGIWRYELYRNYWDYPFTTSNGLPSNRILDVAYDINTSILWAVTEMDTCIYKPAEKQWICLSEESLWPNKYPVRQPSSGGERIKYDVFYPRTFLNLLPHFFANGFWTVIDDWQLMDEYFDTYPVTGFLTDKWERTWLAIEGLGVGRGNVYSQRMEVIPLGLSSIHPRVLQYQGNDLWIGGEARLVQDRPGIVNWRDRDGGWYYYQSRWISNLRSDQVRAVAVTGDSVWFATNYGLSLYHRQKDSWKNYVENEGLYSKEILDLLVHDSLLYIASDKGINTLDLNSGIIKRIRDENVILATVYQIAAQADTLWAATNRGILRFHPGLPAWEVVASRAAISDIPCLTVEVFGDEVWFTSPEGVFWYDGKSKKWESFPQLGLEIPGPYLDMEVNEESVWVSTTVGLLKYDRRMGFWKIFTEQDGLLDNRCFRLLLDGDYIWIATQQGVTQFYWNNPDRID